MLILERPWTRQPQNGARVNWSSPHAAGLGALIGWNNGSLYEFVNNLLPLTNSGVRTPTAQGMATTFNNAQATFPHRSSYACTGEVSIMVFADLATVGFYGAIVSKNAGLLTELPYELRMSPNSGQTGDMAIVRANTAGEQQSLSAAATAYAGAKNWFFCVTAPVSINGTMYSYTSTEKYTAVKANLGGTGAATDNGGLLYVGKRGDNYTYMNGDIRLIAIWNRMLPEAEVRKLQHNPWQLFAPQQIIIPTPPAAATVPTLSASTYVPGSMTSTGWRPQITAS